MKLMTAAAVAAIAASSLGAAPIVLKEHLNQTYGRELISIPFSAKNGECAADGVLLAGAKGNVPAQLSDIEFWPGDAGFVKSGLLWFVFEGLDPLSSATYTPTLSKAKAAQPKSDLAVKPGKDSVEITTSLFGARFPIGGATYETPAAASSVPGPLLAMRLGSGAWAGGSALTGAVAVSAWSGKLVASGPVFAQVEMKYTFAVSFLLIITATVFEGDNSVRWKMSAPADSPGAGVSWSLPASPGVKEALLPRGYGMWAQDGRKVSIGSGVTKLGMLSPDVSIANVWIEHPQTIILSSEGGTELRLTSMNPGAWAKPTPMTYAGFPTWRLDMIPKMWDNWQRNCMPAAYSSQDGAVTLSASVTQSGREWLVSAGAPKVGLDLNKINSMVLDWAPDKSRPHPRIFVGMDEIRDAWKRAESDENLRKQLGSAGGSLSSLQITAFLVKPADERKPVDIENQIKPLREHLAKLGRYDVMRWAIRVTTAYDTAMGGDFLTQEDRKLFSAQMAYLGYLMADPQCWSIERGYISGNPNMSCSFVLSLGIIACAIPDHPAAQEWADYAVRWMDKWLTDEVGENGEWLVEGTHYSYISLEPIIAFAIAAKRAGYHDFSNDPRFKKMMLYFAKMNTPRDVQRNNRRSNSIYGRGSAGGEYMAVFGCTAKFFTATDPEASANLQWMWKERGSPVHMSDGRLGGLEPYYQDSRLTAKAPAWNSELFPGLGAVLRCGFNTEHESFLLALLTVDSLQNLDVWTPEIGAISHWFALGKQVSKMWAFDNAYNERHELLRSGVRLARNWGDPGDPKGPFGHYTKTDFKTFAAMPTADYVESTFVNTHTDDRDWFPRVIPPAFPKVVPAKGTNLVWTRQLMFLKEDNAAGPAWMALRDTVRGGEPTVWQFWTFSEKLGLPAEAANAEAFLAGKPGPTNSPSRLLPMSDRYTAPGQLGVDMEYFIATPKDTPRHTLRYGGTYAAARIPEYQDLLHLQLPGDGVYFVALFPRQRGDASPVFASLANGTVIKIAGAFGTDYAFLSDKACEAKAEQNVEFKGTAGSVQERPAFTILSVPCEGSVSFKGSELKSPIPASLKVEKDALMLSFADGHEGGEVVIGAAGAWKPDAGVKAEMNDKGQWIVNVQKGARTVRFVKK